MFQSEDWEIGEDFLDDFLPEEEQTKKESESSKKDNSPKKREANPDESLLLPPKEKSPDPKTESKNSSRRNKILQLFAASKVQNFETSDQENPKNLTQNLKNPGTSNPQSPKIDETSESSQPEKPKSPEVLRKSQNVEKSPENAKPARQEARTNLINSILKRFKKPESDKEDYAEKQKDLSRENLVNSILKKSAERSQNSTATQEIHEPEELNIPSPQVDNFPKPRRNVSFSNEIDEKAERRKKWILETLKKGSKGDPKNDSRSKNDESTSSDDSRSKNDSKSTTKQVITRKFPGPAGLLPDDVDLSKFPMAYLSSFEESENDRVINESRISEFCSQNTKNLFTGGAWQTMVDDLPPDFLQGHEISMIKFNATKGLFKIEKSPLMAGILHNIDSNWVENPMVILKDSTDQIEASFHLDIFNIYPNKIEQGNVILFKDVGIISSRLYIYALIHPDDVVAIYNEKERIVTTEFMKEILKEEVKRGTGGNGKNREDSREKESSFNLNLGIDLSFRREERNLRRENEGNEETEVEPETEEPVIIARSDSIENPKPGPSKARRPATPPNPNPVEREDFSQILNDDDDDDAFFSINMDEITASQGPKHFASSTLIGSQIIPDEKKNSPKKRKQSLQKREKTPVKKKSNLRKDTPKKSSSVKDFLKQFRSKDDLTQPNVNIEDEERRAKGEKLEDKKGAENVPETSNFADLLESDDDSDAEKPMDVDSALEKSEELVNKSDQNSAENRKIEEKPNQHVFEDPVDEMLSQMDMDAFNFDE